MTQRAVLYARTSKDDRINATSSLQGQLDMCREHAKAQGYTVIAELAEADKGASGAAMNLPMLDRALEMASAGDYDVLVIREIDRFARDRLKCEVTERLLKGDGVTIDYVLYDYPDTPEGNFNKQVRASIAELERALIKGRMLRGRYAKVKGGSVLVHGNAPYGYTLVELENGQRTFEVYEEEARIVRLIFEWHVHGDGTKGRMGTKAIATALARLGVPTRTGGHWHPSTITAILRRTSYYGEWRYAKNSTNHEPISVTVPAIISKETWELANDQSKRNKRNISRAKYPYLVRGYVTCGHCGAVMNGCARRRKTRTTLYYRCATHTNPQSYTRECDSGGYYRADQVDPAVWDTLKGWLLNPDALRQKVEQHQADRAKESEPLRARLGVVDDLLDEKGEQMTRLLDLYLSGDFPKDILTERKTRLQETIEALERERDNLGAALEDQELTPEQVETVYSLAAVIRAGLAEGDDDFDTRRAAIEALHPQVRLVNEDGCKVVYVTCMLGDRRVALDNTGTGIHSHECNTPFILTARIVLDTYAARKAA